MSDDTEIRELDGRTVDRIAAGEVVERPAAAVKELVENSLDAGAGRIEVAVDGDGTDRIRIADDGHGMSEADARLAIRKHTTSKIRDADDLDRVGTLGFRGEALYAIGAVSRLTITTRPPGGTATELTVEGGDLVGVRSAGRPPGTTVEVEDLFFNTPARKKYLGREATEFGHINRVVSRYALANPDVATSLEHDGREVFATTGRGDLREAALAVYGREVAASMVEVAASPEEAVEGIRGYVSDPEVTRSTREYLSVFVNGRYVEEPDLREAVLAGYGEQLAADRYPFVALFVDLPPAAVDANVHPRKLEVNYERPEAVEEAVTGAVREALLEAGIVRSSAPRGRSAPDQATVEQSSLDADEAVADAAESGSAGTEWSTAGTGGTRPETGDADPTTPARPDDAGSPADPPEPSAGSSAQPGSASTGSQPGGSSPPTGPNAQRTLRGEDAHPTTEYDSFPDLRVLGQLHDTYVVAEAEDGLVLIDQHAADERVNYERLRERFGGETTTQALADPVELELTAGEAAVFDSYRDALARLGFHADRVDDRTVAVTAVPGVVARSADPSVLHDVIDDLLSGREAADGAVEALADDLLADLACYPSVTGNTSLTDGSVAGLLSALDDCENPWACPHGRPVLIHIDSDEIDDRFERDYPGH